jgi:hypothetical protein
VSTPSPLDFLRAVYLNDSPSLSVRMRAVIEPRHTFIRSFPLRRRLAEMTSQRCLNAQVIAARMRG